jgi:glutamate 5-kinase
VDKGANEALLCSGSLLPSGIVKVKGDFDSGVVVSIVHKGREVAKGIVEYSSKELEKIKLGQPGCLFRPLSKMGVLCQRVVILQDDSVSELTGKTESCLPSAILHTLPCWSNTY